MHAGKLDLGANNLSGTLPTELGMLVELTELDLRENQFMGGLPSEIGLLTNLGRYSDQMGCSIEACSLTLASPFHRVTCC